ncbi:MAG TPA: zinc-ribbon domain-containing protein [Pyrinomonadaceae bacterium]|nr:zinc-ribbon domain-containing protein [Pyrinomonadaceae bacterium]
MSSLACTRCGAEIIPGTRFCRQCGQPAPDAGTVSEATTRILDAPERTAAPTDRVMPLPTGPAYLSPANAGAPQQQPSQGLAVPPKKKRGKVWLVILLVIVLFGALCSAVVITAIKTSRAIARKVVIKQTTEVPQPPQTPAQPGLPQPPAEGTTIDSSLVYPGAETVVDVDNGSEGHVIQLRTSDPLNKVTDWYISKLKPSQIVRVPGGISNVLRTNKGAIVLTSSDEGTQIIIKQGGEQ